MPLSELHSNWLIMFFPVILFPWFGRYKSINDTCVRQCHVDNHHDPKFTSQFDHFLRFTLDVATVARLSSRDSRRILANNQQQRTMMRCWWHVMTDGAAMKGGREVAETETFKDRFVQVEPGLIVKIMISAR